MEVETHFAGRQLVGTRERQEDSYAFYQSDLEDGDQSLVGVLADGMGGYADGDIASDLAVTGFLRRLDGVPVDGLNSAFKKALLGANEDIDARLGPDSEAGTTFVGVSIASNSMQWISVGDSYLLLYRNGELTQLNEDQSVYPTILDELKRGELTQEEFDQHPHRNALKSFLVGGPIPEIDQSEEPYPLQEGDIVIVASDGIDEIVRDGSLEKSLADWNGQNASELSDRIVEMVESLERPDQDNTSVMVVVL